MTLILTIVFLMVISAQAQERAQQPTVTITDEKGSGVQFTRPDGTPIYINPHAVAFVRAPLPGEIGHSTIVFANGAKQQVEETVEQVIHGIELDRPRNPQ